MTSAFIAYLLEGLGHLASVAGVHHVVVVAALTVVYGPEAWRAVVVLLTGFTVAHGAVLALVATGRLPDSNPSVDLVLLVCVTAVAITYGIERWWARRGSPPVSSEAAVAGGLRVSAREGPGTLARHSWDAPLDTGAARTVRYAAALGFGATHALVAAQSLRPSFDDTASWVIRVFAYDLGVEVAQWGVAAAVLVTTGWFARRGAGARETWVWGVFATVSLFSVGAFAVG